MKKLKPMTIGVLAKSANVSVETIRFYERKSLIKQPSNVEGFRKYSNEDVRIVKLIKRLQGVGFSLDEIKDFITFDDCCGDSRHLVKQKSLKKIEEINQKIIDLQQMVNALNTFANACGSDCSNCENCDLLKCFENEWECCN